MNPLVTAALLMCTSGNPVIATKIANEAMIQDTNVAAALAIGILESGLQPTNPMGALGCYPEAKARTKRTTDDCIRIGVRSLHNRILAVKKMEPSKGALRECRKTGNIPLCRAMIVYNGSNQPYKGSLRKYVYARTVVAMVITMYKKAGLAIPNT